MSSTGNDLTQEAVAGTNVGTDQEAPVLFFSGRVLVTKEGSHAVKRYLVLDRPELEDTYGTREDTIEQIEDEKRIYRHLGPNDGIAEFCDDDPQELAIRTRYVFPGDLRIYLEKHEVDQAVQLRWCKTMAKTIQFVHSKRVLVQDIRTPNWLVTDDGEIKLLDFGVAEIWDADVPMDQVNISQYTIAIELGMLGAVFYELITRSDPHYENWSPNDLVDGQPRVRLPSLDRVPSLKGIFLGDIIEKLWTEGFKSATELLDALEQIQLPAVPEAKQPL